MKAFMRALQRSGGKFAATWLCVFAFALQGYVIQTHIHHVGEAPGIDQVFTGKTAPDEPSPGKAPLPDDPFHCQLCQQAHLSGVYVTPAAIAALPAPMSGVSVVRRALQAVAISRIVTHSWHGRAPPQI